MDSAVEQLVRLMLERTGQKNNVAQREALWESLNPNQKQQTAESRVFISFANATGLVADPYKHDNECPPRPDVRTSIDGHDYYFELGEIVDEGLARNIDRSRKTGMVSGCALSQVDPLAKMLKQKCKKEYETNDIPIDLLLYYWRQGPYTDTICDYLLWNNRDIEGQLQNSQFARIWIYDWQSGKVLWKTEAKNN
ncbi:MAG: hypothetical protein WA634_16160 [Silvibacterium sp.]